MRQYIRRFGHHRRGAATMEYGLVAALIGLAVVGSAKGVAPKMDLVFARLTAAIGGGQVVVVDER